MKKRFMSLLLVFATMATLAVPAFAFGEVSYTTENGVIITDSITTKTAITTAEGKTFVSTHDKVENITTIEVVVDNSVVESIIVDHDQLLADALSEENAVAPMSLDDESDGAYKVQGENTFTNFEYEQWEYPNFRNGNGHFWFLRHPSDGEISVYDEDDDSEYHEDLMTFKDNVEIINTTELTIGAGILLGVGGIVTIGVKGTALLALLDAYLESNDVPSTLSDAIAWKEAVEECQACWLRIFYDN